MVAEADLVMHVLDASAHDYTEHLDVTNEVLSGMINETTPKLLVLNKCDTLNDEELIKFKEKFPDAVCISATENTGIDELKHRLVNESDTWKAKQLVGKRNIAKERKKPWAAREGD